MKYLIKICVCCLFLSCTVSENAKHRFDINRTLTEKLWRDIASDSLINYTKWIMYNIHCSDTLDFRDGSMSSSPTTFGELPMIVDTVIQHLDTVVIYTDFKYQGLSCDGRLLINPHYGGLGYVPNDLFPFFFANRGSGNYEFLLQGFDWMDYLTGLEKKVSKYITCKGVSKVDPWFLSEAKRRGVIR